MEPPGSPQRQGIDAWAGASTPPRPKVDVGAGAEADPQLLASPSRTGQSSHTSFRSPKSQVAYSDRFIPSRATSSRLSFSLFDRDSAASDVPRNPDREDSSQAYNQLLRAELLGCPSPSSTDRGGGGASGSGGGAVPASGSPVRKMFRFKAGDRWGGTAGAAVESPYALSPIGGDMLGSPGPSPKRAQRKIPRSPFKVLDAPALQDDFYLNLVDWSSQNVMAVGLGSCVYLWSACTSKVTKLCDLEDAAGGPAPGPGLINNYTVCSVAWSQRGSYLSVGTYAGETQIWDVQKVAKLRTMGGHRARVGTMSWSSHLLSTGSRDRTILNRDVRAPEDFANRLSAHRSEVCGLRWSPDDREIASGGNDNQLYVWNLHSSAPILRYNDHSAAVKAIAWSPHQHGLLASGGGTADRCIRFWNTASGAAVSCVDTGSQVCNIAWCKNANELVSTHGYSQNQIILWKYPTMAKLATLTGHTMRVLYLAVSPDGQTIVTGAGDETLRFWNVFPGPKSQGSSNDSSMGSMLRTMIR